MKKILWFFDCISFVISVSSVLIRGFQTIGKHFTANDINPVLGPELVVPDFDLLNLWYYKLLKVTAKFPFCVIPEDNPLSVEHLYCCLLYFTHISLVVSLQLSAFSYLVATRYCFLVNSALFLGFRPQLCPANCPFLFQ